jgi:hypothetical protein
MEDIFPYELVMGTCYHGMMRLRVADGGNGFQIRRVAANMLNKQSGAEHKGRPPAWGLDKGVNLLMIK